MADTTIIFLLIQKLHASILLHGQTDQQKMQVLLRLRLRKLTNMPHQSLREVMDDLGAQAQARGLTPELPEDLLRDE
ncbi:MAG TPA: hypothetical protein VFT66_03245 [Roseiflexaceae bacterium]|nr:hypothetical protein [Roseiflexaceae bacterium]